MSGSVRISRRRTETPNGLMEFLIAETIAWAKASGVDELSLNFCVFADLLGATAQAGSLSRSARFVLLRLDRVFQLERLRTFSAKFAPEWRPRFLCLERWTDFPLVGLAYLHAESLLTPPRPAFRRRPQGGRRTPEHVRFEP